MSVEVVLDAPALSPPPNGLLNSAQIIPHLDTGDDARWMNGIRLEPEPTGPINRFDACSTSAMSDTSRSRQGVATFLPFGVEGYDECSTFGFQKADYEGRARRTLAAWETIGVEEQLDDGATTYQTAVANPHFQDSTNTSILTTGTAVSLRIALQMAVQACADHSLGVGMIHARPGVVLGWGALNVLTVKNNKLYTIDGHMVVPGHGYSGKSPSGSAATATSEWVYVTEQLQIHQGEVEAWTSFDSYSNVDRLNNNIESRAQRLNAIVSNKLGIYGIQVNPSTL